MDVNLEIRMISIFRDTIAHWKPQSRILHHAVSFWTTLDICQPMIFWTKKSTSTWLPRSVVHGWLLHVNSREVMRSSQRITKVDNRQDSNHLSSRKRVSLNLQSFKKLKNVLLTTFFSAEMKSNGRIHGTPGSKCFEGQKDGLCVSKNSCACDNS